MKNQALRWILAGLLVSGPLAAEPLQDLQARLAALHSDQPLRMTVDVEMFHRGATPERLNDSKTRGTAIVIQGRKGVEVRETRSWKTSTSISAGPPRKGKSKQENVTPLVDTSDAQDLIDPAGTMGVLVEHSALLSDEMGVWEGRPARRLVVRPLPELAKDKPKLLTLEATIWLNDAGDPIAMERSMEFRLGPALAVEKQQTLTFQQAAGRLLVAESRETYSGTALAVLRGADAKTMKVRDFR